MNFVHSDLGQLSQGAVAIVTLGTAANVRLIFNNDVNFRSYQAGRPYRGYYIGYYRQSPVRMPVPSAGRWHVVVDLGGHAGTIQAGVRVAA
jgi:hypothetical protein